MDMGELRAEVIDRNMELAFNHDSAGIVKHGDVHLAGPPRVDFSTMGLQRRERGPTRILFMIWAQGVRLQRPVTVIIEN